MRTFKMIRIEDESGVSGTGHVAQGVEFDNGKCALAWLTAVSSVALYDNIEDLEKIHGHDGKTIIEWDKEEEVTEQKEVLIWNDKEDRLAHPEEIVKLVNDGKLFVNHYLFGGNTGSEAWVDTDHGDFRIVMRVKEA
jgi:hypothetical protein